MEHDRKNLPSTRHIPDPDSLGSASRVASLFGAAKVEESDRTRCVDSLCLDDRGGLSAQTRSGEMFVAACSLHLLKIPENKNEYITYTDIL